MKLTTPLLSPARIITLAMVGLLILDAAWAIARKGDPVTPGDQGWDYGALAKVPAKARATTNPFESDPDAPAAGRKLFDQHCAECHGRTAEGGKRGPSLRAPAVQKSTSGALFWILTNGVVRRGMPDWSRLPEPERWQIVTYLQALQ